MTESSFTTKSTTTNARKAQPRAEEVHTSFEALGIKMPESKRVLLSTVCAFLTSFTVGYFGAQLTGVVSLAALVFTGSMFLSALVWALGIVCTVILAMRAGVAVGSFVLGFDVSKTKEQATLTLDAAKQVGADLRANAASKVSKLRGFFGRNDTVAAR